MIKIICAVCGSDLPIINLKKNRKSQTISVGFCGKCETMAHKVMKELEQSSAGVAGSTARTCCEDWASGVKQINGAFQMSTLHHGEAYTRKPFNYCPWCGEQRTRY
jgi:hypothetical protein